VLVVLLVVSIDSSCVSSSSASVSSCCSVSSTCCVNAFICMERELKYMACLGIYMFVGLRAYVWYICGCWPSRLRFLQVLEASSFRGGAAKIFIGF
jgi:hypothetical protein